MTAVVTRRARRFDGVILTALSILLALLIGGIMIALSDDTVRADLGYFFSSPADFFRDSWYTMRDAYIALFEGAIFDPGRTATFSQALQPIMGSIYTATPLILGGLAVGLAFRGGMFNIGGEGQVRAGAFCSAWVGFELNLPPVVHVVLAVLAGFAGGALWGFIAGVLKARTGAHEVITTIMLNYVAQFGLLFMLARKSIVAPDNPQASKTIHGTARLPHLFGGDLRVDAGIVIAVVATAAVSWTLVRSRFGFELRAVGANPAAARTAGMSVSAVTMTTMAIAGGLAGLAGTCLSIGGATSYQLTPNISSNVGFDSITVALLGRSRPFGVLAAGLLFGALRQGGAQMQAAQNVQAPIDIITVIQALIVIFIAAPRLMRVIFRFTSGAGGLQTAATNLAVAVTTVKVPRIPRHVSAGATMAVLSVGIGLGMGLSSRAKQKSVFQFSLPGAKFDLGNHSLEARPLILVLCAVALVFAALRLTQRLAARWCTAVVIFTLLVSVMAWAVAGSATGLNVVSLLQGALFPSAIALILGAHAGIIGERAGVVNVAIEGQLLLGAFLTAVVATVAGSIWAGVLGGVVAGVLLGAVLAFLAVRFYVDQVIIGVVLNVFALGITSFLFNKMLSPHSSQFNEPGYFKIMKIPVLGDIPVIGAVFFDGTVFLYATYVLVAAVHYALFHTRWGLRLRSVGEHPKAADTVGINVPRTRIRAVLLAGAIAGLGGAFLVLGTGFSGTFQLNMSSGQGFIALATVIFGRWSPRGAVLAAVLFGFSFQLAYLLALAGAPIDSNLLLMLPYVVTLFAVAGFVGRVRPPAADGQPYVVG